jgi:hypothetical protein
MPGHKRARSEDVEQDRRVKRSSRQEEGKVIKTSTGEVAATGPLVEDPAALLTDARAVHPANAPLRAQAVTELQRQRGNTYVQQVVRRVQAEKGPGRPVPPDVRAEVEPSLEHSLEDVRVHTDGAADEAAEALEAKAFTMDKDIFFSQRHAQNLSSSEGTKILAHELTHVVQQSGGNLSLPGEQVKMGRPGDAYEREADAIADEVANRVVGAPSPPRRGGVEDGTEDTRTLRDDAAVQRQAEEEEEEEEYLQAKHDDGTLQRQPLEEEEGLLQPKRGDTGLQRQPLEEEEELLQPKRDGIVLQRQPIEEEEELLQASRLLPSSDSQVPVIQAWQEDELVPMPWVGMGALSLSPVVLNEHLSRLTTTTQDVTGDLLPALEDGWDYLQAVIPMHRERLTALAAPEQARMTRAFAGSDALRGQMTDFQTKESTVRQKMHNNLTKAAQYEAKVHALNSAISGLGAVRGEAEAEGTEAEIQALQREWDRVQQTYDDIVNVVTSLASVGAAAATGGGAGAAGAAPGALGAAATIIGREVIRDRYHPRIQGLRTQLRRLRTLIGQHRVQQAGSQVLGAAAEVRAARHEVDGSTEEVRGALIEYQAAFRELAIAFRGRGIETPLAMLQAENEMVFQADGLIADIERLRGIREAPPVSNIDRAIQSLQTWRSVAVRQANLDLELRCDHNIGVLRSTRGYYGRAWELWSERLEWLRGREYLTMVREARGRMELALEAAPTAQAAR